MEGDGVALVCLISGILFAILGLASFSILWAVNWRPWRIYRKLFSSHGIRPAYEMLEEKLRQGLLGYEELEVVNPKELDNPLKEEGICYTWIWRCFTT